MLAGGFVAVLTGGGRTEVQAKHHKHKRRHKKPKHPVCAGCQPVPPVPACDVCLPAGACAFATVQAAIDATAPQLSTIRVCAGTYVGNPLIERPLTIIGAGDGEDPATNTILQGTGEGPVVELYLTEVTLQRLRITGGQWSVGGGIYNAGTLALVESTVAGNRASQQGGGIRVTSVATLTLIGSTVSGNTSAVEGGGGIYNNFGKVSLDAASRVTGNHGNPGDADSGGGIYNHDGTVTLSSAANVSGNTPDQCGGAAVPLCAG
jgi:parallel beta-helix repeat protein